MSLSKKYRAPLTAICASRRLYSRLTSGNVNRRVDLRGAETVNPGDYSRSLPLFVAPAAATSPPPSLPGSALRRLRGRCGRDHGRGQPTGPARVSRGGHTSLDGSSIINRTRQINAGCSSLRGVSFSSCASRPKVVESSQTGQSAISGSILRVITGEEELMRSTSKVTAGGTPETDLAPRNGVTGPVGEGIR